MIAHTKSDFETWLPPPAALRVALGLWLAGFFVAGAAAIRLHQVPSTACETPPETFLVSPAPRQPGSAAIEANDVLVMPEDVIYARQTPATGATMEQEP